MKELVLDYIAKYPYLPKRALAKIMFAENPGREYSPASCGD
jgi:hypothetical protein